MPVIQALPRIAGTIAGRSPTIVSATMRPSNVEPITDAWVIASPTRIAPRAWSVAIRAERPVPVAERSSRPGATTTAFFDTAPTPCHGSAICDDADAGDRGVLRMHAWQLLARSQPDPLADERELARLARLEREAERVRIGDRVPHAAERDIDGERAEAVDLELRIEAIDEARNVRQLDALALAVAQPAVTSTTPAGASSRNVVSGSRISTMPVSSRTVATQIVFEPDMAGYSVGSMMM